MKLINPYFNFRTGLCYRAHSDEELKFVEDDSTRWTVIEGPAGSGKTTVALIKVFEKLRQGCNGALIAKDFPYFTKALWPDFHSWCDPEWVIERERHRLNRDWYPNHNFALHFSFPLDNRISTLFCGGGEDPMSWHGPNLSFALLDDLEDPNLLKVLEGRVRVSTPSGTSPQIWATQWDENEVTPYLTFTTRRSFMVKALQGS